MMFIIAAGVMTDMPTMTYIALIDMNGSNGIIGLVHSPGNKGSLYISEAFLAVCRTKIMCHFSYCGIYLKFLKYSRTSAISCKVFFILPFVLKKSS